MFGMFYVIPADLSPIILYAVVRVAVLASRVHYLLKLPPMLDLRSIDRRHCAWLKQLRCQKEINIESGKIPLRLVKAAFLSFVDLLFLYPLFLSLLGCRPTFISYIGAYFGILCHLITSIFLEVLIEHA